MVYDVWPKTAWDFKPCFVMIFLSVGMGHPNQQIMLIYINKHIEIRGNWAKRSKTNQNEIALYVYTICIYQGVRNGFNLPSMFFTRDVIALPMSWYPSEIALDSEG